VTPDKPRQFVINVRIPGWARNEPVPSALYKFLDAAPEQPTLKVNGQPVTLTLQKGYVAINRTWRPGDVIDLTLPMPVRRIVATDQVVSDRGRVALQRGPVVYAAEWPDNPNGKVRNVVLADDARLASEFRPSLLKGVQVITGRAVGLSVDAQGTVQRAEQPFMAIPYATWANRGKGQMEVWIARNDAAARPTAFPTVATSSTLTHSPSRKNIQNIVDGEEPPASNDPVSYFDWWPTNGCRPEAPSAAAPAQGQQPRPRCSDGEWVEMKFEKPATVSQSSLYWFDDTGRGGVRVPQSWRLLYKDGEEWKPVDAGGPYGVAKDAWNMVTFKPVTTSALRLELKMQPGVSAGIQEWRVK
jgi:uncharacterized protein